MVKNYLAYAGKSGSQKYYIIILHHSLQLQNNWGWIKVAVCFVGFGYFIVCSFPQILFWMPNSSTCGWPAESLIFQQLGKQLKGVVSLKTTRWSDVLWSISFSHSKCQSSFSSFNGSFSIWSCTCWFPWILDLILVRLSLSLPPVHKWQQIRNIPRGEMYIFLQKQEGKR